jgi:hypothetical protein
MNIYELRGSASLWWFNKSEHLHAAAFAVWYAYENNLPEAREKYGFEGTFAFSRSVFCMNAGLSIELLIKAILVIKNRSNFKKVEQSHNLIELSKKAKIYPLLNENQVVILDVLTEFIYWVGKYPVAKTYHEYLKSTEIIGKVRSKKPGNLLSYVDEKRDTNWKNYEEIYRLISTRYWDIKEKVKCA